MVVTLGISFIVTYHYMEQKKQEMANEDVLGTATQNELTMDSKIDYIHKNSDGSSEIKYIYTISNLSPSYRIKSLLSQSNLKETFGNYKYEVVSLTSGLASNPNFDGATDTQLLAAGNVLEIAQNKTISLTVKFYPETSKGPFENKVAAQGDIELPPTQGTGGSSGGSATAGGSTSATPPSGTTGGTTPNPAPVPTPTPSPTPAPAPTPAPQPTPTPVPPAPVIDFTGLKGTSSHTFTSTVHVCYNCGLTLVWNVPNQPNCIRSAAPPTSQWQGSSNSVQGKKDITSMTQNTVFSLDCSGEVTKVNLTVSPKPQPAPAPTPVPPTNGGTTGGVAAGTTTGGTTGQSTGGNTGGLDPSVAAASRISFTLPDDEQVLSITNVTPEDTSVAGTVDITPLVKTQVLPNTDLLPFHTGLLANLREWITDNILGEQRNKIVIDKIGVNGEILEGHSDSTLNDGFWRMPETSTPELGGNTVIAGHRFDYTYGPLTFHNLNKLSLGDEIKVIWFNKTYTYKIDSMKIVDSDNLAPIENNDKNTLTLITCTSLTDSSQRLIVKAILE